eukprot:TRINITY_DN3251_c0_g2_i2.p1 TRINITY_DN3251_c0_g2~~TRINITY_DN3251_c0_g2_i2.p1  ORF type:complete len:910 (-),score=230.13 TRINITY_DN3251_c0_g2_i2:122-2851(-)
MMAFHQNRIQIETQLKLKLTYPGPGLHSLPSPRPLSSPPSLSPHFPIPTPRPSSSRQLDAPDPEDSEEKVGEESGAEEVSFLGASAADTTEEDSRRESPPDAPRDARRSEGDAKRVYVLEEIIHTERCYVKDLGLIVNAFLKPLREAEPLVISKEEINQMFLNVEAIYLLNRELLGKLESVLNTVPIESSTQIGSAVLQIGHFLKLYSSYCSNYKESLAIVSSASKKNANFMKFLIETQENNCKGFSLSDFLIKPIQRICKYPLLFRELLSVTTPDHPDYEAVLQTLSLLEKVTQYANQISAEKENISKLTSFNSIVQGFESFDHFRDGRKAIRDEWFSTYEPPNVSSTQRHLYLFNDMVVVTKLKNKRSKTEKIIILSSLNDVTFFEPLDTDKAKPIIGVRFTLETLDQKTLHFLCSSQGTKMHWLNELKSSKEECLQRKDNKNTLEEAISIYTTSSIKSPRSSKELKSASRKKMKGSVSSPSLSPSKATEAERRSNRKQSQNSTVRGMLRMKRTKSIDNPEPQQPDSGSSSTRTIENEDHEVVTDSEEFSLRLSSRRKLKSGSKIQDQDIPESLDSEYDNLMMTLSKPPSSVPKLLLDTSKSTDSQEKERKGNSRSLTGRRSLVSQSQSPECNSDSPFESKAKTYRRPSPRRPLVAGEAQEDKMRLVTQSHQRTASTPVIPGGLGRPPASLPPPLPVSPIASSSTIVSTPEEVESVPFGSLSPQTCTSPPSYPPPPLSSPILPPPESLPPPLPNTVSPLSEIQNQRILTRSNQSDTETDLTSPKTTSRENGHRRRTRSEKEPNENFISPRENSLKSLKKQDSVTMRGLIPSTKERLRKRYLSRSKSGHGRKNSETQKSHPAKCCSQCAALFFSDTPLESSLDKPTEELLCPSCSKTNLTENTIPLEL